MHAGGRPPAAVGVRSQTTCGVPVLGSLFSSPLFLVPYVIGAFKFFTGYSRTSYVDNLAAKLALAAAWCALSCPFLLRAETVERSFSNPAFLFVKLAF